MGAVPIYYMQAYGGAEP